MSRVQIIIWTAIVGCGLMSSRLLAQPPADPASAATRTFNDLVAPLLARRCLECHNASDKKGGLDLMSSEAALVGGDSGPPITPGKLEESIVWEKVASDEMPPKKPLSDAEKQILADWVASGAVWGQSPIDRFRYTSDVRAGYDWWSLKPVVRPDLPVVHDTTWPRNPIDTFVLAKLEAEGLAPSPEADRRTLLRRLAFDLTGLPPTPDEVAAFVADADPKAYEKQVDRLLDSPEYGERWARHWLDLARFGESNGFEYDEPRHNSWPYRDWVIGALNRDLPFDEFARQQLAGDALRPDDVEAIKATGFLVAGAYDTAGQNQQSAAMKAVVRQDELEDIIGTTFQTFLALTVHCARCHDHKFDPILQTEYYQLASALGGVRHGERDVTSATDKAEFARQAAESSARLDEVVAQINALEEPIRTQILAERKSSVVAGLAAPLPLARWEFDADLQDSLGGLHGTEHGGAELRDGGLLLDGKEAFVSSVPLEVDLQAKTLEVWVSLADLRQSGGGVMAVQTLDGAVFDAVVFAECEEACWQVGSDNFSRTQDFDGPAETEAHRDPVHLAIVYDVDGTITGYRNGRPYGKPYRAGPAVPFKAGQAQVVFGIRHGSPGGNRMFAGTIYGARLYDRALSPDEVAASASAPNDFVAEAELVARLSPEVVAKRKELLTSLEEWKTSLSAPAQRVCYAVTPRQPEPAHLLLRGDIRSPAEVVAPGGVRALAGLQADFGLAPDAPEAERRVALAQWVTNPQNPLFPRVIVNRLWHYHFGVGLVDTPSDFGFNGSRPSHPQLLDWLAATLIDKQWSLKQLHRMIVLSATYRQRSLPNPAVAERDAENRWLWRKNPVRLEAEVVRDSMLAIAGELNPSRLGPGFRDCTEVLRSGTYTYEPSDPEGPEYYRRSVYRMWTRGGRSGLLDAFDCPDPSTTAPRRAITTTPLQALALLHDSFVLRMADKFAERVSRDAGDDVALQITRTYQLAYMRDPTADEMTMVRQVVELHGLSVLTRAIFNSSEFLYVD